MDVLGDVDLLAQHRVLGVLDVQVHALHHVVDVLDVRHVVEDVKDVLDAA